jgi:hypothetical protein
MNVKRTALIGCLIVLAGLSIACGSAGNSSPTGTTKDQPVVAVTSAASTPKVIASTAGTISGDGIFSVPTQVKLGTYRTVVPADSYSCYWERLKDASGDFEAIIANDVGQPGSQLVVQIKKTDKFFKTEGCGTWTKIS